MSNFIRTGANKVTNAENLSLSHNETETSVTGRDADSAAVESTLKTNGESDVWLTVRRNSVWIRRSNWMSLLYSLFLF